MTGKGEYYVRCKNCGRLIKVFSLQWQGYCINCETLFNYDTQDIVFSGITTIPSDYHYEWKKGQNLEDELSKYKRAFEILKDYSIIPPLEDFRYSEYTNCYFAEIEEYDHDYEDYRTIHYVLEKDEYELLEELMRDENN